MAKIRQLPSSVVAKIAAGEVIERPAYAVKELIENAIDAKATDIQIYIEQAGIKKIQVIDNGEGMGKEDLLESVKLHTTSKLPDESLIGIQTLGFRGEALSSLAAVSDVTIKSRISTQPTGNEITVLNGKVEKISPVGMPSGTVVTVSNLFGTIPARKKFLKSSQTESRHIVAIVTHYAAAFPGIGFRLVHNGKVIFDIPKTEEKMQRIRKLVGEDTFGFFLPIHSQDPYISISGFIAKPQMHSSSPNKQFLFVNNRKITDRSISLAVKESYATMLESTAYPVFVLFLDIPHQFVDINVHPRKEHVSFINQKMLFEKVKNAILQTLQENNLTFQNLSWKRAGTGTTKSMAAELLREHVLEKEMFKIKPQTQITQFHNLYLAIQTKNGVVFIDQHAAHERILFEKLLKEFSHHLKKAPSRPLTTPVALQLSATELLLISEHENMLKKMGFKFAGKKNKNITHVPELFTDRDSHELVRNILEYLDQEIPLPSVDKISEEMLAFLACRSAIKSGDQLEQKQMKKIVIQLEDTPRNATCPHGRPTRIFYSLSELNKNFQR